MAAWLVVWHDLSERLSFANKHILYFLVPGMSFYFMFMVDWPCDPHTLVVLKACGNHVGSFLICDSFESSETTRLQS